MQVTSPATSHNSMSHFGLDIPSGFMEAAFSIGELLTVTIVKSLRGPVPLLWSVDDCIRVRSVGRIAVTPIGQCPTRVESNGKAAAVPAMLSDEELCVMVALGWVRLVDSSSSLELSPTAVLAESLASASCSLHEARLRRIAFMDLWAKGYFMTSGIKFGVDWLTYRADPTSCHAAFMLSILPADAALAPLDLIARARVATTALKICAFAYVSLGDDSAASKVSYRAFRRMGVGTVEVKSLHPLQGSTVGVLRQDSTLVKALGDYGFSLEQAAAVQ